MCENIMKINGTMTQTNRKKLTKFIEDKTSKLDRDTCSPQARGRCHRASGLAGPRAAPQQVAALSAAKLPWSVSWIS